MGSEFLQKAANDHYDAWDEWALSIVTLPNEPADQIAAQSRIVRKYARMRVTTAAILRSAGYEVVRDGSSHGLVLLPSEPDEPMWAHLRSLMTDTENPHYEG